MNSLEYLLSFQRFGIKLGLENITYMLERLGNPHFAFPAIHITGTNGKGSVAAFLTSVLEKAGYVVGRYISPHLVDFSERLVVNGKPVTPAEIDELVAEIRPVVDDMQPDRGLGHPTFFEAVTAIAFRHFARHRVDFAVVEVGMGGRYDSTNIVRSCLSIITNVHLEHREYLGDTVEKIAIEKAGIIKPGIEVVSAAERPEARTVIDAKAGECGSPVYHLGRDFRIGNRHGAFPRQFVDFAGPWNHFEDVEIRLAGNFQAVNAGIALMGTEILRQKGLISLDERLLREGMVAAHWPARLEKISDAPFILLDGAHNPSAMRALVDSLRALFGKHRIVFVLGMLSDKDVEQCLRILREISDCVVITQPAYERALPAEKLLMHAREVFPNAHCEPNLSAAMKKAVGLCRPGDIILVAGSLFNVAEAKDFVAAKVP